MLEQNSTRAGNIKMQASWANRSWCLNVGKTLAVLNSSAYLSKLGLNKLSASSDGKKIQTVDIQNWYMLTCKAAGEECFSSALHSHLSPHQWSGILDDDEEMALAALDMMIYDYEWVTEMIKILADPDNTVDDAGISAVLNGYQQHLLQIVHDALTYLHFREVQCLGIFCLLGCSD